MDGRSGAMVKPRMSILNRAFRYVPSAATDVSKTFAREYKRIAEQKKKDDQIKTEKAVKVRQLGPAK